MKKKILFLIPLVCLLSACTKYRDIPAKGGTFTPPPAGTITFGTLRINEFICKGTDATAQAYLMSSSKWFELYNPTSQDVVLTPGQWYITDTLGIKNKFAIPQDTGNTSYKVPANGFLVIMCLKSGANPAPPGRINASFSLSSTIGSIGIYYQATPTSSFTPIDTVNYNFGSGALSGVSYGRRPDGQNPATLQLPAVTAEHSNN